MDPVREKSYAKIADQVIKNLRKRRMNGSYAPTGEEAVKQVVSMIPEGSIVSFAGSMTLKEFGVKETVCSMPNLKIIDPSAEGLSAEEKFEVRRQALLADFMITGTNAVTLDGKIVNLDGMGNRVSGMIFGPKKVILVTGINKVVSDVDEAMKRVKHWAAPINVVRLDLDNPCRETLLCSDCKSPSRICNMWTVIEGHSIMDRLHVVLVGEFAGY